MQKVLFGIFAHPDDEAFGPSASLYHAVQTDTAVHLVLLTDGEMGRNPDNIAELGQTRLNEWEASGKLIGVTSCHALHYPDGGLSNNLYLEIAEKILEIIHRTVASSPHGVELELMTFDQGGITGHLDHIAASYITTYVYLKLRERGNATHKLGELKYYCLPQCLAPNSDAGWLYMTCGKADAHCDEIFDYTHMTDVRNQIMRAHYSQREDMEAIVALQVATDNPCRYKDHFCYFKD